MIRAICILCVALLAGAPAAAATLAVRNDTNQEIINILVQAKNPARELFLRLDLLPESGDVVENPACAGDLRVDTGLEFWRFRDVNLAPARKLTFCAAHPACLILDVPGQTPVHLTGASASIGASSNPICNLDSFHPAMPMKEVCAHLPASLEYDDNGALLTALGFAGAVWSARLIPAAGGEAGADSLLDHLELRRPLDKTDLAGLVRTLYAQGYVPWQAEFPGRDMELASGAYKYPEATLLEAMRAFVGAQSGKKHKNHAAGERCEEASVLLAPKAMLPELENADEPRDDVQLFTILMRPCTNTLLLDIDAYRGEKE